MKHCKICNDYMELEFCRKFCRSKKDYIPLRGLSYNLILYPKFIQEYIDDYLVGVYNDIYDSEYKLKRKNK